MTTPTLSIRVDFAGGRLGPGKIALLEAIAREGSISAAGRALAMSYRRAWELVDQMNGLLGGPVVATATGGQKGGGASLTPLGQEVLARYRAVEAEAQRATAAQLAALQALTRP